MKYRVTNRRDNKGLLFSDFKPDLATGKPVGEAWQFRASGTGYHAIHGPYIREPLRTGKYRATFKLKVDDIGTDDVYITYIDVVSIYKEQKGAKVLAARTLTSNDFGKSDEYREFNLDFDIFTDEREVEFRVAPTNGFLTTLDFVQLSRRLP